MLYQIILRAVKSIFFLNVNSNFNRIFVESKLLKLDQVFVKSDVVFNVEQAKFDKTPRYSEILVHCLTASTQEQAKKVAIYEKK